MKQEEPIESYDVRHLPIICAYLEKLKIAQIIDKALEDRLKHSPGRVVMGLVADVLTGRSPLYRVEEFFVHQDMEMVIGANLPLSAFNDTNIGRVLDGAFDYGTQKLFSEISLEAVKTFSVKLTRLNEDTTSENVWGAYEKSAKQEGPTITYGNSKDKRPDLKQFMLSLLCAEKTIPIAAKIEDGNASDRKINTRILSDITKVMLEYGVKEKEFIYVGDCALVSPDNLKLLGGYEEETLVKFVTRLPETYNECSRVKKEAVATNEWQYLGKLSAENENKNRPVAVYKSYDTFVNIDEQVFRAVVIHSNLLDRRRQKKLLRQMKEDKVLLEKRIFKASKTLFACEKDALLIGQNQSLGNYHQIEWAVNQHYTYKRGRPEKGQARKVAKTQYILAGTIIETNSTVEKLQEEIGCFVLLSNISKTEAASINILEIYKEQYGIEQNFGFLKDPLIANDLFLKNPRRIEALGLILLISLMVWRLIERDMRKYVTESDILLTGWDNKQTNKPTSFMMATKFSAVHVLRQGTHRWLARPLQSLQIAYLKALGLTEEIFVLSLHSKGIPQLVAQN